MLPEPQDDRRLRAAWRRLLRVEEGVALVLAMLTTLGLTISLTGVLFLTAAGARDAHHSNAGQNSSTRIPGDDDLPGQHDPLAEHHAH